KGGRMKRVQTPWGLSDDAGETFGADLTLYTTPSHGGFHATGEAERKIRAALPVGFEPFAHRQRELPAPGLWLEEDCDWAFAALALPERFKPAAVKHAIETARHWIYRKDSSWQPTPAAAERAASAHE